MRKMMIAIEGGAPAHDTSSNASGVLCPSCTEVYAGYRAGYVVVCLRTQTIRGRLALRLKKHFIEVNANGEQINLLLPLHTAARREAFAKFVAGARNAYALVRDAHASRLQESA
jgi:hypothetical protein